MQLALVRGARAGVRRAGASNVLRVTLPAPRKAAKLHFWATRGSDAKFNLQDLRAE
jgi:hypothetical protein